MRTASWMMALASIGGFALACGDDGGGTSDASASDGGADGGDAGNICPSTAPSRDDMMGACCYRRSNSDRLPSPQLRVAGLQITSPSSLASSLVVGAIQAAIDEERFNWLIDLELESGTCGAATAPCLRTGYGERSAGDTYAFAEGGAPTTGGGDPNRWDPQAASVDFSGDTLTGNGPLLATVTVPVFASASSDEISIELPLNSLELVTATFTEDRSCVGSRRRTGWDTSSGELTTYITVESAMAGRVEIEGAVSTFLCNFIAGSSSEQTLNCDTFPRSDTSFWKFPPDSLCGTSGCEEDPGDASVCDPADDCNAWKVAATFAAQGIEITN